MWKPIHHRGEDGALQEKDGLTFKKRADILNFYEFFAGGGMARCGLGADWTCLFANDFDHKKAATYKTNWGGDELVIADVGHLESVDLPGSPALAWASFPCQDLSLAGGGAGLRGERSGTFWPFWKLMEELRSDERGPKIVVLENVCGTLTSHGGKDFTTICKALRGSGYRFGAVVVDAALFVPHSRPRLFIIAVSESVEVPEALRTMGPVQPWHPRSVKLAVSQLPKTLADEWVWWNIPTPKARCASFADLLEETPESVKWHSAAETRKLIAMMSEVNREKLREAKRSGQKVVGAVYKRTRRDEAGRKVQRAEVRFDDVAGCLRTPAGGSSRQTIVIVEGQKVRSRLISSRETARLMGLPDSYVLPENYNEAYHLTGDGVAVPVVEHLARHVLEPIMRRVAEQSREAA